MYQQTECRWCRPTAPEPAHIHGRHPLYMTQRLSMLTACVMV